MSLKKLTCAFAVVAGAAYAIPWMIIGMGNMKAQDAKAPSEYSDNGLRVLESRYSSSYTDGKPKLQAYALLLDSKEHGLITCHGMKSWPQNTVLGQALGGEYPETIYANSPLFELVYKKSDQDTGAVLNLGSCFPYETELKATTINALADTKRRRSSWDNGGLNALADIGWNHTYYGLPVMSFLDNTYGVEVYAQDKENDISVKMGNTTYSSDITRITNVPLFNDTVRDRRYMGLIDVIRGETSTSERHSVTPQICQNAGFVEGLVSVAANHRRFDNTPEKEKARLESLGDLKLTVCP